MKTSSVQRSLEGTRQTASTKVPLKVLYIFRCFHWADFPPYASIFDKHQDHCKDVKENYGGASVTYTECCGDRDMCNAESLSNFTMSPG